MSSSQFKSFVKRKGLLQKKTKTHTKNVKTHTKNVKTHTKNVKTKVPSGPTEVLRSLDIDIMFTTLTSRHAAASGARSHAKGALESGL